MGIKRTKYCALKSCKKPIRYGSYCDFECAQKDGKAYIIHNPKNQGGGTTSFKQEGNMVKIHYKVKMKFDTLTGTPAQRIDQFKKQLKKRIKPRSKKRQKEYEEYNRIRPIFLEGKICPITKRPATEIHHKKGKIGKLLCDQRYFLGVTREGHEWIENNPEEAYRLGYSIKRTAKEE